jgi:hypothetical protein
MATLFATGTGADAVITLPAPTDPSKRLVLGTLLCSYTGNVSTGRLRLSSGPEVIFDIDAGSEASKGLPPGMEGAVGQGIEIRLFAGGGNVVGKINLLRYWQE